MDFGWKFHLGDDWGTAERLDKAGQSAGPAAARFNDGTWRSAQPSPRLGRRIALRSERQSRPRFQTGRPRLSPPTASAGIAAPSPCRPKTATSASGWNSTALSATTRVFLNGYLIGHHESGYNSFRYDITDVANCGGNNILAVRVDASRIRRLVLRRRRHLPPRLAGQNQSCWPSPRTALSFTRQFSNNVPRRPGHHPDRNPDSQYPNQCRRRHRAVPHPRPRRQGGRRSPTKPPLSTPCPCKTVLQTTQVAAPVLWSPEKPRLYKLVTTVTSRRRRRGPHRNRIWHPHHRF